MLLEDFKEDFERFLQTIKELPLPTPKKLYEDLGTLGYIGQEIARKALCLMAFRHINRIKKNYIDKVDQQKIPAKENMLLLGPTGCGKTFLVELLFKNLLKIPTVIIDITSYSETGYVGQDVNQVLTGLLYASEGVPFLASIGIVCIDEFDKIASGKNSAVFAGQGTTKDVTGMGVQRELLKMLESCDVDVPVELSHSGYAPRISLNTTNIPFIVCSAFSGFRRVLKFNSAEESIGFNRKVVSDLSRPISREDVERAANFEAYGIMPELIGRFSRIVPFSPLTEEELRDILEKNTIKKYGNELSLDGIKLNVEKEVYRLVISKCQKKETGARGLNSFLSEALEDACFEVYSAGGKKPKINLFVKNKEIAWDIVK